MEDRLARGREIGNAPHGVDGVIYRQNLRAVCPTHADATHDGTFGTIWDIPAPHPKMRHLMTSKIAVSMDAMTKVMIQTRGAVNRGGTQDEIVESIPHRTPYGGFPKADHAFKAAKSGFDQWDEKQRRIGNRP